MLKSDSPYLNEQTRLADVVAAIQVLGTYKFYKLDFASWADRITGDSDQASHWRTVFEQHPEFFRLDAPRQKVSLVWRRQHRKRFDVDRGVEISRDKFFALSEERKLRISRTPLRSSEIETLMKTAISLHAHALDSQRDQRFWVAPVSVIAGALIAGLVGIVVGGF